jgi:ribulose-phosphate 3-epimerase
MVIVAPSILSADFARLGEQVVESEQGGAGSIHIDVMDGHFVPNLTMGPAIVKSLRRVTRLPLEIHLMVEEPERFIDPFLEAGADSLIGHLEVLPDPRPFAERLHARGKHAGLAVRPDTAIAALAPYLAQFDLALCMTVHPGFSGQHYLPESPERIRQLRELIDKHNPKCELEVDGGITGETGRTSVQAGANVLVAATSVFGDREGPTAAVRRLLTAASAS